MKNCSFFTLFLVSWFLWFTCRMEHYTLLCSVLLSLGWRCSGEQSEIICNAFLHSLPLWFIIYLPFLLAQKYSLEPTDFRFFAIYINSVQIYCCINFIVSFVWNSFAWCLMKIIFKQRIFCLEQNALLLQSVHFLPCKQIYTSKKSSKPFLHWFFVRSFREENTFLKTRCGICIKWRGFLAKSKPFFFRLNWINN